MFNASVELWEEKMVVSKLNYIEKCIEKYGNKYQYDLTKYVNKQTKIKYKCPKHGEIEQYPLLHLKSGCPYCNGRGISKHSKDTFIEKARSVHGDYYNYDKVEFKNMSGKVLITCPKHGDFLQKANNHVNLKNGCPKCKGGVKLTKESFLEKANKIHKNKFTYDNVNYTKAHNAIEIKCPIHGEFKQLAYMHLQSKYSCPKCVAEFSISEGEEQIKEFIESFYKGKIIQSDRQILDKREIDVFIPELKLGIEYNGMYWHNELFVNRSYHLSKLKLANKKGIRLIQIFENEWQNKREIVQSRLKCIMGFNDKIYARKTKIIEITNNDKKEFLENTHIQGNDASTIHYGLEYDNKIVAVMTFGKSRFNAKEDWELMRFSSALGVNVTGGASKLFHHFLKHYNGSIVSYADKCWSNGNLYDKLGFSLDKETEPGYIYYNIKTKDIINRMQAQKHKLKKLDTFEEELSESDNMKKMDYFRIYDCGNLRYVYNN